jgi:hypothetical protein
LKEPLSDDDRGWSQAKTVIFLDESRSLVSEDIRLAHALDYYPELANISTKTAAKRALLAMMLRPS